ncbi:hypothetical protein BDZ97DRAFT_1912480 [Flammula alnicola]|nr:hypothetical protein BDZ97DRAFT_1912480 [Flammula alnicola]
MFFTPELLAKRDSGFGLLWLAATLGSRSTFKKLPKRSVLTADITQLCDLISEPAEPLALRLSSNLMFGVVRVYKGEFLPVPDSDFVKSETFLVKQEILMTDVTNCVTSLKKVVQDLRSSDALDAQLQMANPVARVAALTIVPDPKAAYVLDYDAFVANWEDYLNIGGADTSRESDPILEDDDADFDPSEKKKKRTKAGPKAVPQTEVLRKEAHTLEEHHEHLLSASFDLSFNNNTAHDLSSSQAEAAFDNFFPFSDGLDLADGLGDDLARELGWGASPIKSVHSNRNVNVDQAQSEMNFNNADDLNVDMDFNFNADDLPTALDHAPSVEDDQALGTARLQEASRKTKGSRKVAEARKKIDCLQGWDPSSLKLAHQDVDQPQPLRDITKEELRMKNQGEPPKKLKRTRLLLDARTELTDAELKIARAKYLESQSQMKQEILTKKLEKDNSKVIEELVWGVPKGIQAQSLINFWQENFKVQVEARSGVLRIHEEDEAEPARKRRKSVPTDFQHKAIDENINRDDVVPQEMDWGMDWATDNNMDMAMVVDETGDNRHSSEEPGQARRISRSASVLGASNFGFDLGPRDPMNGSQRSSLFPWDNAGPSSSTGNGPFPLPDDDHAVAQVDVRLRSISLSRRNSPLLSTHRGSMLAAAVILSSPAAVGRNSQIFGEDFVFDVENAAIPEDTQQDTQKSDLNLITLERNSFNFLEYAKMQYQTLAKPDGRLTFDTIVPTTTSTRHVAAAAFYHCLGAFCMLLHCSETIAEG